MKNNQMRVGLLIAGSLAGLTFGLAQMQTVPIQTEGLAVLQGLQPVPTNTLPDGGTFWLLSQTNTPPLPFFPYANLDVDIPVPVYPLGSDVFLVDDRQVVAVEGSAAIAGDSVRTGRERFGPSHVHDESAFARRWRGRGRRRWHEPVSSVGWLWF